MITRRHFLGSVAAAVVALPAFDPLSYGEPLGLPLGLQLYSVREQMRKDFEGTLAQLGTLGYREVESAGYLQYTPAEVRRAMTNANLQCISAHVPFGGLQPKLDEVIAFNKELGVEYIICSSPGFRKPAASGADRGRKQTIDDWHYNAEQFNLMGEKIAAAGMQFGYHNHTGEFAVSEGVTPYLELLRLTDPKLVTMELDCGWAIVGGMNPVDILRNHPGRVSMLHVKDFKITRSDRGEPTVTELGKGSIDYVPILHQARQTQKLKHMFIEQEAYDLPWIESLQVDAQYLRDLKI